MSATTTSRATRRRGALVGLASVAFEAGKSARRLARAGRMIFMMKPRMGIAKPALAAGRRSPDQPIRRVLIRHRQRRRAAGERNVGDMIASLS